MGQQYLSIIPAEPLPCAPTLLGTIRFEPAIAQKIPIGFSHRTRGR